MKTLSINELAEQEKGQIWVLNCSNERYKTGADVFITIMFNGQSSIMSVPRTWLPIELTQRFPRKAILESQYFVDALNKGLVKAVPAEVAQKILAQDGVAREQKRLRDIQEAIEAATSARGIGKNVSISTGDLDRDEELQRNYEKNDQSFAHSGGGSQDSPGRISFGDDDEEDQDPISANFRAWVNKVNGIEDSTEALAEVKMRGSMEMNEAEYLMNNSVHENITAGIAKRLKKLKQAA